ncbi:hypothetical protein ACLB2K_011184 [Fragaria x ananassa]
MTMKLSKYGIMRLVFLWSISREWVKKTTFGLAESPVHAVPNNYETDLIRPIIEKVSELAKLSYSEADEKTKLNYKIVGDHMRAIVYLVRETIEEHFYRSLQRKY